MKKISRSSVPPSAADELRDEYQLDYRKARPNRFAGRVDEGSIVVTLDADVSKVFTSSESVNSVLRALIEVFPNGSRVDKP